MFRITDERVRTRWSIRVPRRRAVKDRGRPPGGPPPPRGGRGRRVPRPGVPRPLRRARLLLAGAGPDTRPGGRARALRRRYRPTSPPGAAPVLLPRPGAEPPVGPPAR